jgi:cytochrome P450
VTHGSVSVAHATAQQACPVLDGIVDMQMLLIGALVQLGASPHACAGAWLARLEARGAVVEWHRRIPECRVRKGTSARPDWPSGLIRIDSLPLNFPAEAYAAR